MTIPLRRGDLVTVALQGDLGKPRPALIIQSDFFITHPSITILPITSDLHDAPLFRINIKPNPENGLNKTSQIMVDKPQSIARDKIGTVIGHLDDATMLAVNRALLVFLGFA